MRRLFQTARLWPVLAGVAAVCLVFMALEVAHGRFWTNDFEVYHRAGQRFARGEPVYQPDHDGFYRFLYLPTAAAYFVPMAPLPYPAAQVAFWILLTAVVLYNLRTAFVLACPDCGSRPPARVNVALGVVALTVAVHVERELHLGQVNQVLLASFLYTVSHLDHARPRAGAAWAASLFLKPVGLILAPYAVITRRWAWLFWGTGTAAALFLLPMTVYGPGEYAAQLRGFVTEVGVEFGEKRDLMGAGNHMVYSALMRYLPGVHDRLGPRGVWVAASLIVSSLIVFVYTVVRRGAGLARPQVLDAAVLLTCIPLIAYTSHNAFGFVLLAVCVLVGNWERLTPGERVLTVAGCVLTGMNWHDVWGHQLWNAINDASFITFGSLALLGGLAGLRFRGCA